ncbi:glycosyltransferase family 2 protein [Burkholderia stagnalis]|uniref:Glycosyltransferase family 2 protein n=1 Tax=Burkholderia stagnalis TaxID=1503054 RepID=A0ABX9YVV7_9BURK|nr:glycosyltransferase family 2 protein [Burkholderia stagnalis]RQQ65788.1 glycosyltransferase family 2 protein [Burkholderia stagnalis]RQQ74249.1 glycosyltransferase family 2 protein [Burkholderia stagnalis]RQQ76007.1 glycosyltransferase family 2 protein [Burkholderia stagnalis]RQQ85051.1 glycosyltransferase family 2 protein [Burkholderia stagnalis]RQQ93749.1 glycosyltransferase family 2 protein [Burkholderia stagnalis]
MHVRHVRLRGGGVTVDACIVIPIYNHRDAIGGTLARLSVHGLPVIVVDDGSDAPTQQTLAALAQRHAAWMKLVRLPVNGGKGAAVMAGLRAARADGYTHAIQIDADGQHDAADVPAFVAAAQAAPDAVILGRPLFDESVPKARLYGRYLTHVWVWIETLSLDIADAMCGFRLYPLDAVCRLIDSVSMPTRMDFDSEILVRLHWRGLAFRTIPTRVVYPADGLSHFDVLWDNVRISASHTRLVAGMLARAPLLLARRLVRVCRGGAAKTPARSWWRMPERGSRAGMTLLALSCRWFGTRITSAWLYPIVGYFVLTHRAARVASHGYFARLGHACPARALPKPGWGTAYRHMLTFAQAGFDKFVAWSGRADRLRVRFDDATAFDALAASGRGALVIGAHLGNLEMTRALALRDAHTKVTAIVYTEHAKRFNSVLSQANAEFAKQLVEVADFGPETAIMMQSRIDAGELLVIVGDRVPAHDAGKTVDARFLDANAAFAQGPYVLAHALGCPVYLFFCLKEGGEYRLYFESFAERIDLPRRGRAAHVAEWAQRYAARLEHYCRKAPYQWFNFFDFWARPDGGPHDRA